MALSLEQIRAFVRGHIDLEEEDLPNSILDVFVREASKRIEKADSTWPFYEATWTLETLAGERFYSLDAALLPSETVLDQLSNVQGERWNLAWVGREQYDLLNGPDVTSTSEPRHYAQWARQLWLSPTPDAVYTITIRGYRQPTDWIADGAGATPDLPDELHNAVAVWALGKAYAQQEDPEMATVYFQQFSDEVENFRRKIVELPHPQPMVLNGRGRPARPHGRLAFPFEV